MNIRNIHPAAHSDGERLPSNNSKYPIADEVIIDVFVLVIDCAFIREVSSKKVEEDEAVRLTIYNSRNRPLVCQR